MDGSVVALSSIYLSFLSILGVYYAHRLAVQSGSYLSTRPLLLLNFVIVYPVSGIIHLLALGPNRGYFDLLNTSPDYIYTACAASTIAFLALMWGLGKRLVNARKAAVFDRYWDKYDTLGTWFIVLLIGPLALYGLTTVQAVVEGAQSVRNITLASGNARFVFLSQWFPWVVTMAAAYVIVRTRNFGQVFALAVVATAVIIIVWSVRWSGGRSIIIVFILPLLAYSWPYLKSLRVIGLVSGSIALAIYILFLSKLRQESYLSGQETNIFSWIDWEWGRFSMVGVAIKFTDSIRMLLGESVINGIVSDINPFIALVGLQINTDVYLSSLNVASVILIGSYDFKHIVPGLTAEAYMNYGFAGVAVAYFLLGRLALYIDQKLSSGCYGLTRLFLYYVAALVAFRAMVGETHILLFYILYAGLPLALMALVTSLLGRRSRRAAARRAATVQGSAVTDAGEMGRVAA